VTYDDVLPPISQSGRFSPAALAFAIVLHVAAVAGLWWLSPFKPFKPQEEVIEVTVDRGGAPPIIEEPAPAPEQKPAPQSLAMPRPEPPPQLQPQPEPPRPPVEQAVPPPEPPPPPPTAMDFPKAAPPPPPPQQQPRPPPQRPPQQPAQQPAPRPPENQAAAPAPSPLTPPTDVIIGPSGPSQNDYFVQLARRLAENRYYPQSARDRHQEGRVVVRVVIARNGQLIDARVERSSGVPAIDEAELDTVRRSSPFPPLPLHIAGQQATFLIPVNYKLR